jgi:hypothetical protein
VERSVQYLNWRYASAPDVSYLMYIAERKAEVAGYLVLRFMTMERARVAIIFEVLAESAQVAQCLIAQAVEQSRQRNVDLVYCASIAGKLLAESLRRSGFMSLPFVKRLRFCAYSTSPDISKESLRKPENWFVQMGDSDML